MADLKQHEDASKPTIPEEPSEPLPELHVIAAGLPRNGKSTGLNNIFGLDFPTKVSATPVTDKVVSVKTTKNGISLTVTDTPGLNGIKSIDDPAIMRDIKKIGAKNTFLLILTLPVSSNSSLAEDYRNILVNLTAIFGKKLWNWCLILLTFSDTVRECEFPSNKDMWKYLKHIKEHCAEFEKVLRSIDVNKPVNPFFNYTTFDQFRDETLEGIVAIPVGKNPQYSTERLFPITPWTNKYKWTDLAFMEIAKVNESIPKAGLLRVSLIQFRYAWFKVPDGVKTFTKAGAAGATITGMGTLRGIAIGAEVGRVFGDAGGLVGLVVGGVAGTVAGAVVGIVTVATASGAVRKIDEMVSQKEELGNEEKESKVKQEIEHENQPNKEKQ